MLLLETQLVSMFSFLTIVLLTLLTADPLTAKLHRQGNTFFITVTYIFVILREDNL